jgi:hypothetical protein
MNLQRAALGLVAGTIAFLGVAGTALAEDKPYVEGPVTMVNAIRTEPGMFNTYLKYLQTTYKPMMEDAKKAGHVLDWKVYRTTPDGPNAADLYLTVTYKNMAAFDGLEAKMEAIQEKYLGDQSKRDASAV